MQKKVVALTYDDNQIKDFIKGAIDFYNREKGRIDIIKQAIAKQPNDPVKQRKLKDLDYYRRSLTHYKDFIDTVQALVRKMPKKLLLID